MKVVGQKRKVDYATLQDWIEPGSKVLDLGCGRGILLHDLKHAKQIYGVGVDISAEKILGCVKRGVNAFQGDILEVLRQYPDGFFDWVVLSRTMQELDRPLGIVQESLRAGKRVAVGFVNYGYYANRMSLLSKGRNVRNEVYPEDWWQTRPANPISIGEFEYFCQRENIAIQRRVYLKGDWKSPCRRLPGLFAGYAIYELRRV